ncbi:MAG TPA: hypothetical protein IAB34_01875 [Candidatus Egerieimonas faecigallinarum]|nr:hypothetical protein [Candidatus Egerieimonas faecigallinarum]
MSRFLKVVVNIILLGAILVAASLLVPPIAGITTAIVDDETMDTNLDLGSVTYAKPTPVGELAVGDRILEKGNNSIHIYRLDSAGETAGSYTVTDVNETSGETRQVELSESANKVLLTVPYIGYAALALQTTEGLIIIGLGVVFIIILFILAEVWKRDEDADMPGYDIYRDEDEELTKRELKALKKQERREEKKRRKAEKKRAKGFIDDDEEDGEEEELPVRRPQPEREKEPEPQMEPQGSLISSGDTVDIAEQLSKELGTMGSAPETEAKEQVAAAVQEAAAVTDEPVRNKPVELAIPVYSAEELLKKAEQAGDKPEVKKDEDTGVTILDYSDIL